MTKINIAELFPSIQGEGPAMGRPSIFIRLSQCNQNCVGCDSPIRNKVEEFDTSSVVKRIENYRKVHPTSRIVFTGGEPLLQPEAIASIMDGISGTFDLETNGTLQDSKELFKRFNIIVVSPKKTCFKTVKESSAFIQKWLEISKESNNNVFFKFVLGSLPWAWAESEISDVIRLSGVDTSRVWLMPAGDNPAKMEVVAKNTWKIALRLNCNYSDRLHIRCSGR